MKLSDLISFLNLTIYPSVALVFFLAAFLAILVKVLRQPRSETNAIANMPLNDDVISDPRATIKQPQSDHAHTDKGNSHG